MPGLVQDLVANAEVWWCTTWRHRANDGIRVHLGISDLPVVDDGSNSRQVAWKPEAAGPIARAAIAEGRPVYWIEDFYGRLPNGEMPDGVVYVDTAAATDRAVLTPSMVPALFRSDGPLRTAA